MNNLEKKLKGLQIARQKELNKSKVQQRKLNDIEDFIKNFYMHPYSKEVIEIKNKVMEILDGKEKNRF